MTRTIRAASAMLMAALALTGCSSSAIDVPEGAEVTIAPAPSAETTPGDAEPAPAEAAPLEPMPTGPVQDALDCATVLPVETIESVLDLPAGFVASSEQEGGCAWTMAGNPQALSVESESGATADDLAALQSGGAEVAGDLGDQSFFRPADPAVDPAATVVVLEGERLLTVRSYVGDQESLETLADSVLTALG